jgi:hypothetical protein
MKMKIYRITLTDNNGHTFNVYIEAINVAKACEAVAVDGLAVVAVAY